MAAARAVDPDDRRDAIRRAQATEDRKRLTEFADDPRVSELPAPTLRGLGHALFRLGHHDRAAAVYQTAVERHPADFWVNFDFGYFLQRNTQPRPAARCFTAADAIRPNTPVVLANLAAALMDSGDLGAAERAARRALALRPGFAEAHFNLGSIRHADNDFVGAEAAFREAIRFRSGLANAHERLALVLSRNGDHAGAAAAAREAVRLRPGFTQAHQRLISSLGLSGNRDGALAAAKQWVEIRPKDADAHYALGVCLRIRGESAAAIAPLREAVRLRPEFLNAWTELGEAHQKAEDPGGAENAYRRAIWVKPDHAPAHFGLGLALKSKNDLDGAVAAYREAIRLRPEYFEAHSNLGLVLEARRDTAGAIAAFREAVRYNPEFAIGYCNLATVLTDVGQYREAVAAYRRGYELGSRDPNWPHAAITRKAIRHWEVWAAREERLPLVLLGWPATDPAETAQTAVVCVKQKLDVTAARLFARAFAAGLPLATDRGEGHRYDAACAAVLAGCGQGRDATGLDWEARAALRAQGLAWLRAELMATAATLARPDPQARKAARDALAWWLEDSDFAGVRDGAALLQLPAAERAEWQTLWAEVALLRARTEGPAVAPLPRGKAAG